MEPECGQLSEASQGRERRCAARGRYKSRVEMPPNLSDWAGARRSLTKDGEEGIDEMGSPGEKSEGGVQRRG